MNLNRRKLLLGMAAAGFGISAPSISLANMSRSEIQLRNTVLSNGNKLVGLYDNNRSDRAYLMNYFYRNLGAKVDPSKTPWCAAYVDAVLAESGLPTMNTLWARNFLDYGVPTDSPEKGDIAVFTRGKSYGHVGFFLQYDGADYITLLNGNVSGKVLISNYPRSRLLGFRRYV